MPQHKYRAIKTVVDGITFPSKKQAKRYTELRLLVRAGEIENLELEPVYQLWVNGVSVGRYKPDFRYTEDGKTVCEEVKGYVVRDFPLRRKVFKACFPDVIYKEI